MYCVSYVQGRAGFLVQFRIGAKAEIMSHKMDAILNSYSGFE